MQRRDLKRGALDARDRARHRGRARTTDGHAEPLAELADHLLASDQGDPRTIDLVAWARETSHIGVALGERYRQLAIHLECAVGSRDWTALDRIYRAAFDADPDDADIWSSWALARFATQGAAALDPCVEASRRSVALDPDNGHLHGIHGMLLYEAGALDEAAEILQRAMSLGHHGWPELHLAHTLHDQERWEEAADAYARIDASRLPPRAQWRVHLAHQQRAHCLWMAGLRERALEAYADVLQRYERALDAGLDAASSPVLAAGPPEQLLDDLHGFPELAERTRALCERLSHHDDPSLHCRAP